MLPSRSHSGFLPSPVTSYSARSGVGVSNGSWQSFLLQRARTTNLAVLLLAGTCALSLLANLTHWLTGESAGVATSASSIRTTLPPPQSGLTHLIIVPCHSIWLGIDPRLADRDDQWLLEPYQQDGSVQAWLSHIHRGIDEVVADPSALLVFSGGQTRLNAPFPGLSEAASYARLAASLSPANGPSSSHASVAYDAYWAAGQRLLQTEEARRASGVGDAERGMPFTRATTEEFALDSFSNLMFSIARFKEVTDRYPRKITIVGYAFKAHRFLHSHLPSLRWPSSKMNYVGIDGSAMAEGDRREERYGGERQVLEEFSRDRYACRQESLIEEIEGDEDKDEGKGEEDTDEGKGEDRAGKRVVTFSGLGGKRRRRNPGRRWHGYLVSASEMRGLLEWCPSDGTSIYPGRLPWAQIS